MSEADLPMGSPSGVVAECPECDYETLVYPRDEAQANQWRCGYRFPDLVCPEPTHDPGAKGPPLLEVQG